MASPTPSSIDTGYSTVSNVTAATSTFDFQKWSDLTAKFNFASSTLSAVTVFIVLVVMAISPRARSAGNRARTVLLLLLFSADFVNAFFNSISGYMRLQSRLEPGNFCNFQGFIGQVSIQASDLATFALALVTFAVAQSATSLDTLSTRLRQVEAMAFWMPLPILLIPLATATTGYLVVGMAPTGSWCWFAKDPKPKATIIRYAMTHGPRMFMILCIVLLYSVLFWAFRKRIREQEELVSKEAGWSQTSSNLGSGGVKSFDDGGRQLSRGVYSSDEEMAKHQMRTRTHQQRRAILKLLIYPTTYTLLWIPGLANRFAEASSQSPETLAVTGFLQFTTQLLGFANSLIYGYSQVFGKGIART
ncbi:hypothetical protein HDU96_009544 [Phlyctochytrium bullatum]|nr:hypothetical protein HDU96_009544 [Phlyctochytrium bullatum]